MNATTKMDIRTWRRENRRLAITGILISLGLLSASEARGVLTPDTTKSWSDDTPANTTSLWVEPGAKVISTPSGNGGKQMKVQWLLKARGFSYTIALFMIKATVDIGHPDVRFRLEARDGFRDDSPLIAWFRVDGEAMDFKWNIKYPLKAQSGFLLLQFFNDGYVIPQFHFCYFICGGLMAPTAHITTPYFPQLHSQLFNEWGERIVECDWKFIKADDTSYECLMPRNIAVTDCTTLYMRSNTSLKVYEKVVERETVENVPSALTDLTNLTERTKPIQYSDAVYASNTTGFILKDYIEPLCGNHIQMIVFEGKSSTLRYYSSPRDKPEFIGDFRVVSIPSLNWNKEKRTHWFFVYCNIAIFAPIGILIGMCVICYQDRDKRVGCPA